MNQKERQLRRDILNASFKAGACHLGGSFSCLEILMNIMYEIKPDYFLFGKASGEAAYYSILCDQGYFKKNMLVYYLKNYPLSSKEVPGVLHSCGSVGHGLPVAVGLAYANPKKTVYCLISDGDVMEGTTWESALFARQHKLTNLYVVVDNNKMVACGATEDILGLDTAFDFLNKTLPNCFIMDTVKGEGVSFMAGDYEWHYKNLDKDLLKKALSEI